MQKTFLHSRTLRRLCVCVQKYVVFCMHARGASMQHKSYFPAQTLRNPESLDIKSRF